MLRKGQSNGYIGKAELSKNRKKKTTFFSIFFEKISTWSPAECISAGLHVEFLKKILNKKVLLFFFTVAYFRGQNPFFNFKDQKLIQNTYESQFLSLSHFIYGI